MRLVAIILGTLLSFSLILGTVYFWGIGRVFPKYSHPFFEGKKPSIVAPWSFTSEIEKNPEIIIWADVYSTSHDTLMVGPWGENEKNLKYREEVVSKDRPLLTDLFRKYPDRKFILNIVSNTVNINHQVLSVADKMIQKKQIALQSSYDIILRAMKETFADLPYGSSQSDYLRFNVFNSLAPWTGGLLPAAPFRGDFYVAPFFWKKVSLMNQSIVDELHRRQKYVIIGPLKTFEDFERAKGLGVDGYLFDSEKMIQSYTTPHVAQ